GTTTFGYKVEDAGADGANVSATAGEFSMTVNAVADAPKATGGALTVDEDGSHAFSAADFGFTDVDGDDLAAVIITSLPESGELSYKGSTLTSDDLADGGLRIAVDDLGDLVFKPAPDFNGSVSFGYKVEDTGPDGTHVSAAAGDFTITVDPVSDAPEATTGEAEIDEDGQYTFEASDFGFTDVDGDELAAVIITSLPENGTLRYNGEDLTSGHLGEGGFQVDADDLPNLVFVPDADFNGTVSFGYKVQDAGAEGANVSTAAGEFSIKVNPVSDAPEATTGEAQVAEDGQYTFSASDFGFTDVDGDELAAVIITSLPDNGTLRFDGEDLTSVHLAEGGFQIDVEDIPNLEFVPDEDFTGTVSFSYKVQDTGADDANVSVTAGEFSITVAPISDAPEAEDSTVKAYEDRNYTFGPEDFRFTDADGDDLDAIIITSLPDVTRRWLFLDGEDLSDRGVGEEGILVTAEQLAQGLLVFQPKGDFNGPVTFEYKVKDAGDTELGGENTSAGSATLTIKVRAVNDTPEVS